MSRTRNPRRLLLYSLGVFCILSVFVSGCLFRRRYRNVTTEQIPKSQPPPKDPRPIQDAFSATPQDPVVPIIVQPHIETTIRLSSEECHAEFPGLFAEIDRSVALRNEIGNVTLADIDLSWKKDGAVRVLIYNQKVKPSYHYLFCSLHELLGLTLLHIALHC